MSIAVAGQSVEGGVGVTAADSEVILYGSLIDAMTFWCAGFRNVIAAYGVNAFAEDHA